MQRKGKTVSISGHTRVVFPEMYWKFGTKKLEVIITWHADCRLITDLFVINNGYFISFMCAISLAMKKNYGLVACKQACRLESHRDVTVIEECLTHAKSSYHHIIGIIWWLHISTNPNPVLCVCSHCVLMTIVPAAFVKRQVDVRQMTPTMLGLIRKAVLSTPNTHKRKWLRKTNLGVSENAETKYDIS